MTGKIGECKRGSRRTGGGGCRWQRPHEMDLGNDCWNPEREDGWFFCEWYEGGREDGVIGVWNEVRVGSGNGNL